MVDISKLVKQGFDLLLNVLVPYTVSELKISFNDFWWEKGVFTELTDDQKKNIITASTYDEVISTLDIKQCLSIIQQNWNIVFSKKLSEQHKNWVNELITLTNKFTQVGMSDFNEVSAYNALDTMAQLSDQLDTKATQEINSLKNKLRSSNEPSTSISSTVSYTDTNKNLSHRKAERTSKNRLSSWRSIIQPHPDVASGLYQNAEFAANLYQVSKNEGSPEYRDAVEFFSRTYITTGLSKLLSQALKRIAGQQAEPVLQLKTSFGGGKTHSMLALYHLLKGKVSPDKLPGIPTILDDINLKTIPTTHIAVIVGTALNPTVSRRPKDFSDHSINTIWGEIAYQLAKSTGNKDIFDLVKESDSKSVSPGSEALNNIFDLTGPCLILMDELVAYARKIFGHDSLPSGSFDNFITFIQEVTEAAKSSKNCLIVATLPESDLEIGGQAGQQALEQMEHYFGRIQTIWKPVAPDEGFEIVRRRLFLECTNTDERDKVCSAFSKFYRDNPSDFPFETKELDYKNRLIACYPIHPEVFDRLYGDWATIDSFQKTRGVLRLMAAVIHKLWINADQDALIMPGSLPFDDIHVKSEFLRYIPEQFSAIVDSEVDGPNSKPLSIDNHFTRYGEIQASRRISRTIMLGSAPSSKGQNIRGLEKSQIRLGVVQPNQNISNYNDALNELQDTLTYLYTNESSSRFWYDTRPTLKKTVQDRVNQYPNSKAYAEIESRLKKLRPAYPLGGLHVFPKNSSDILDDQILRLVIVPTTHTYQHNKDENPAIKYCEDIIASRGNIVRANKNMLIFLAADQKKLNELVSKVKLYLAWKSIIDDIDILNIDRQQQSSAQAEISNSESIMLLNLLQSFCWLLIPQSDKDHPDNDVDMLEIRVNSSGRTIDYILQNSLNTITKESLVITNYNPIFLHQELNSLLWSNNSCISVQSIWNSFTSYCYMPKLADFQVLQDTIKLGLTSSDYFAIASGIENDKFINLRINQTVSNIDPSDLLVKVDVAQKQLSENATTETTPPKETPTDHPTEPDPPLGGGTEPDLNNESTHFYMSAEIDPARVVGNVDKIFESILKYLINSNLSISLEVDSKNDTPFSNETIRTIKENCNTLKIKLFEFNK
ncbi:MAG: DUF499 domain-containing protein [Endomicrobium sp.]|jgi:predicted AAA+ superfamily ATPase|nr:DUF499 domain-containing protein [Endomicrobium sp.]